MNDNKPVAFRKSYSAFLFDMDGTLLSSIEAAERVWGSWAQKHGLDVEKFLPTIHGVKAAETIARQNISGIDLAAELEWVTKAEMDDVGGIFAIAGVVDFLNTLPKDKWAIVTSATLDLATIRLAAAGISIPDVIVTGQDVVNGKPAPDCFQLGARRLGVSVVDCLIFEDAPAGIAAGEAAGADVVVITATHQHPVDTEHTTLQDYNNVGVAIDTDGLRLVAINQP